MVICNNGGDVINEGRNGTAFATNVMGADGIISRQLSGAVSYYLKNAHGDIVYMLNDSRTKTATYKYSAWGEKMTMDNIKAIKYIILNDNVYRNEISIGM